MYSLIAFLIVVGVCVLVHESGHYIAAKICGVKVHEFSIGMGPAIVQRYKFDSLWSLRCIPVGGYVRMAGEDSDDPDNEDVPDAMKFDRKSPFARIFILFSGAFFNFLLAFFIIVGIMGFHGVMNINSSKIGSLVENSLAEKIGMEKDSIIKSVNGTPVVDWNGILQVTRSVDYEKGESLIVETELANGTIRWFFIDGETMLKERRLGIVPSYIQLNFIDSTKYAVSYIWNNISETFKFIYSFISGKMKEILGFSNVSNIKSGITGPVGIAVVSGEALKRGWLEFIGILMMITIGLGTMNLIPFPALDGFKIITTALEGIFGFKLSPEKEKILNLSGFCGLILLLIFVTKSDILSLFN